MASYDVARNIESESERRFRVYEEAPGFRPSPCVASISARPYHGSQHGERGCNHRDGELGMFIAIPVGRLARREQHAGAYGDGSCSDLEGGALRTSTRSEIGA